MAVAVRALVVAACGTACAAAVHGGADDSTPLQLLPSHDDDCTKAEDKTSCGFSLFQSSASLSAKPRKALPVVLKCGDLRDPDNEACKTSVNWMMRVGKHHQNVSTWLDKMEEVTGIKKGLATIQDFQRLSYCVQIMPDVPACGIPPCQCSRPPCNTCGKLVSSGPNGRRVWGCDVQDSIACKPPKSPLGYRGMQWPTMTFSGTKEMHIFCIGDWGGMDGSLVPEAGRVPIVAYDRGKRPGPSIFPRTRWSKGHSRLLCSHEQFIECFQTDGGAGCAKGCGYTPGVDDMAQFLVANTLRSRAAWKDPSFLLNVGDNFYWGGIEKTCGTPMHEIANVTHHQFNQIFESIYFGLGLDGKPWLSVLGNHDWGGRMFLNGWDQQIAYTWASPRWVMPAPYYFVYVEYPDQDFNLHIFMLDSNFNDAKEPDEDPQHNICGKLNPKHANCRRADGPDSVANCAQWFSSLWSEQQLWLEEKLAHSHASWQIVVTHFPCGTDGEDQKWYKKLHKVYGLDFLVTGHRHNQELWLSNDYERNHMGGLTCIVTGGGGGITSESTPDPEHKKDWLGEGQYGFYDLTITKQTLTVESINYDGTVLATTVVRPKDAVQSEIDLPKRSNNHEKKHEKLELPKRTQKMEVKIEKGQEKKALKNHVSSTPKPQSLAPSPIAVLRPLVQNVSRVTGNLLKKVLLPR